MPLDEIEKKNKQEYEPIIVEETYERCSMQPVKRPSTVCSLRTSFADTNHVDDFTNIDEIFSNLKYE